MKVLRRAMIAGVLAMAIPFLAPGLAGTGPEVTGSATQSGVRLTIKASGRGPNASGSIRVDGQGPTRVFNVTCLMGSGNEAAITASARGTAMAVRVVDSKQGDQLFFMETNDPSCTAPTGTPQSVSSGNYRVSAGDSGGGLGL